MGAVLTSLTFRVFRVFPLSAVNSLHYNARYAGANEVIEMYNAPLQMSVKEQHMVSLPPVYRRRTAHGLLLFLPLWLALPQFRPIFVAPLVAVLLATLRDVHQGAAHGKCTVFFFFYKNELQVISISMDRSMDRSIARAMGYVMGA